MSILLDCQNLEKSYSTRSLFAGLSFGIFEGDRLGLIGHNGSGKSTLMKILAGLEEPGSGDIIRRSNLKVSYLAQSDSFQDTETIEEALIRSPNLSHLPQNERESTLQRLANQFSLPELNTRLSDLSGGWRKRVLLAEALLLTPDLLLLDEPTNHLDIDSVLWLEGLLRRAPFSWVVISHDRQFLENTVNKVAQLSSSYPKGIFMNPGGYRDFLAQRAQYLKQQQARSDSLSNKMRTEDDWLSRGPKARGVKQKARIDRAEEMRSELGKLNEQLKTESHVFDFSASGRKTKKLVEAKDCRVSFGPDLQFGPWSVVITNGLKLGILGRNGSGKSTLMKLMTKVLEPDEGQVRHADNLKCVYFDQKREHLDEDELLKYALAEDGTQVVYRDRPIHVVSWAKKFLFRPEQLETPISKLSGGERAKVILARLMLQPAEVLALDEPTNDLDINALETLEDSIRSFPGAALIISHDRYFLESVCHRYLGFDLHGQLRTYTSFAGWLKENKKGKQADKSGQVSKNKGSKKSNKKLSYLDQREYDGMEGAIEEAEARLLEAQDKANDPSIAANSVELQNAAARLDEAQKALDQLYERWAELEAKMH